MKLLPIRVPSSDEIFHSWNQGEKYHLAFVPVGEEDTLDEPHCMSHPFKEELGW